MFINFAQAEFTQALQETAAQEGMILVVPLSTCFLVHFPTR